MVLGGLELTIDHADHESAICLPRAGITGIAAIPCLIFIMIFNSDSNILYRLF